MSWYLMSIQKIFVKKNLLLLCIPLIFYWILPFRFLATSSYEHIPNNEIENHLVPSLKPSTKSCPILPKLDIKMQSVNYVDEYNMTEYGLFLNIKPGGSWKPTVCEFIHDVAVIVPYRGRSEQLKTFLHYIHPFLQRQLLKYTVFIIEQTYNKSFNRAKLMNIGYAEAMKVHSFHCFIFHDIDLLPQVAMNMYACTKAPRHLSCSINTWRYNLLYGSVFGGVTAMLEKHFLQINGFSNLYFGWGGEDDDISARLRENQLEICRFSPEVSRYYMLKHKQEVPNPKRNVLLQGASHRFKTDGLNSLDYKVTFNELKPLYTHIIVDV